MTNFDYLAVTRLDVLSNLKEILICTHFKLGNKLGKEVPSLMNLFPKRQPVYKKFKGWPKNISKITKIKDMPKEIKNYLQFIERELKVPIRFVSVGADRKAHAT